MRSLMLLAEASNSDSVLEAVPWWAKLISGFVALIIGISLAIYHQRSNGSRNDSTGIIDTAAWVCCILGAMIVANVLYGSSI